MEAEAEAEAEVEVELELEAAVEAGVPQRPDQGLTVCRRGRRWVATDPAATSAHPR